jgi:hypothetical protein
MHKLQRGLPDPRHLLDRRIDAAVLRETLRGLKIGNTFKATNYDRFPATTRLLARMRFARPPVVLDVGASDGSAALAVMNRLRFMRYYVTDRHIRARAWLRHTGMFLCDMESRPWLYANRCFVVFNHRGGAWPFNAIAARIFKRFDSSKPCEKRDVLMINPDLAAKRGDRVRVEQYDIFDEWNREKADLVIAANLLNRAYFPDADLRAGLRNLRDAMHDGAVLAVIENRNPGGKPVEQSSIFTRSGMRFHAEAQVGSGSDIQDLVTGLQ